MTAVAQRVPFAGVEIAPAAQRAALQVLRSGWVTMGKETAAFEAELARYLGARQVVAVSSCTAAIELALRALRLRPGAAVLTPSLTFCGAVAAILHAGLRPVLADVDEDRLVPTAATVAQAAHRVRPAAMVVQHMAGHPIDVPRLAAAAGLDVERVIEDAAHGLGAERDGVRLGAESTAACFSFYATKNLPIGEGGAIATGDDDLAVALRTARLHGMSADAWQRYLPGGSWRYDVEEPGLKANFTDLQAAIGRAQLAWLPRWQAAREQLVARYDAGLSGLTGLRVPVRPRNGRHAWHLYQVRIQAAFGAARDQVVDALAGQGVGTSVHFIPVHRLTGFRQALGAEECRSVPVTDRVADEVLSLPLHPALTYADVDHVIDAVRTLAVRTRAA